MGCRPPRWPMSRCQGHLSCQATFSSQVIPTTPSARISREAHRESTPPSPYRHPSRSLVSSALSLESKPHYPSTFECSPNYSAVCSVLYIFLILLLSKTPFANMQYCSLPHLQFSFRSGTRIVELLHANPWA